MSARRNAGGAYFLIAATIVGLVATPVSGIAADDCSGQAGISCGSQRRIDSQVGQWEVAGVIYDLGPRGFKTSLTATLAQPGSVSPGDSGGWQAGSGPSGIVVSPIFCRRDDYAFLPPGALAGIPCDSASSGTTTDPRQIARSMFDQMVMPSLRLDMNPRLGMVNVPTWFWVEGYDGAVIPLTDDLRLTRRECRRVADRDANGLPQLDAAGLPRIRLDCQIISDTLTVEVRVWPRTFEWRFGDERGTTINCPDMAACPAGIGLPYTDPRSPSPIAHAYRWSSLGVNGASDAYTIGLGITFGAQYRFSTNGGSLGGWQALDDRALSWTATHKVQEAQAVLTGP